MARKSNPWMVHLAKFRKAHPNIKFTEAAKEAVKTYKKQAGGSALGGDLSPTDFKANPNLPTSGDAALQVDATQYSGGKKSRRKSSKKSRKARKTRKSKSCKRR